MQSALAKNGNVHKMKKRREETCKNNMVSTKNETVVLRMIYKSTLNVPTTPAACGGTGSSVKRSENWSHPITSIGLGRQTTTTLVGSHRKRCVCQSKIFSTFLSKITKYNRVPLGFDHLVARLLGHDPTPRPTCPVPRGILNNLHNPGRDYKRQGA